MEVARGAYFHERSMQPHIYLAMKYFQECIMHLPPEMDVDKGLFINSVDFKASEKGGHSVKTIHLGCIASTGVPYYKSVCLKISNIWISPFHQNNFDMFNLRASGPWAEGIRGCMYGYKEGLSTFATDGDETLTLIDSITTIFLREKRIRLQK